MYLLGRDNSLSWPDLSVDNAAKTKSIGIRPAQTPIVIPNLITLSILWDITAVDPTGSDFVLTSVTPYHDVEIVADPSNALTLLVKNHLDDATVAIPKTFGTGISKGYALYLFEPAALYAPKEMLYGRIDIVMTPGAENVGGYIRTIISEFGTASGVFA